MVHKKANAVQYPCRTFCRKGAELVLGQACNPPDPDFLCSFCDGGLLQYSVPKWLLLKMKMGSGLSLPT
jgi:hypothetical protein